MAATFAYKCQPAPSRINSTAAGAVLWSFLSSAAVLSAAASIQGLQQLADLPLEEKVSGNSAFFSAPLPPPPSTHTNYVAAVEAGGHSSQHVHIT